MNQLEIPGFSWGVILAGADLSASQYRAVNLNSSVQAVVPSAGGRIVGIRQNKPTSGQAVTIVSSGVVLWEAGAAVTAGANVSTDNAGRCVDQATTAFTHGVALAAAGAAGVLVPVLLQIQLADQT